MPYQKHSTIPEGNTQEIERQDDWTKEVVPRLPAQLEEQAQKLKAFERCRKIGSATDLLRGLLASVYTTHSFQHVGMWSILIGLADVSANDWRNACGRRANGSIGSYKKCWRCGNLSLWLTSCGSYDRKSTESSNLPHLSPSHFAPHLLYFH